MAGRVKKRAKKQTSRKTTVKRKTVKKTVKKKIAQKTTSKKATRKKVKRALSNQESLWNAYKNLQAKINVAWKKLRADVKRKANPQIITEHRNHLLLLLGECNYMARECMKSSDGTEQSNFQTTMNAVEIENNPFKNQH